MMEAFELDDLDRLVLEKYPYPIAVYYKKILDEQDWEKKTRACIWAFDFGMRLLTLTLASQYITRDIDEISDPEINRLLLAEFSKGISLGTWLNILFKLLNVYKDHRDLLFVQELYDFYWDRTKAPHVPVSNVRAPFERLVQIRNGLAHQPMGNWHLLFDDAFGLLKKILGEFEFIKNYDLVHVIKNDNDKCRLDIYSGVNVKQIEVPCDTVKQLTNGWFYLSKQNQSFLPLHPLLIGWQGDEILPDPTAELIQDTGLFEQFQRSSIAYITSALGQKVRVKDIGSIEEFVVNVIQSIEKAREREKAVRRLSWMQLKEITLETSKRRMSSVLGKYNAQLYLERNEVLETFDDFLKSDKVCFVLTGKSGIGKTNFLLALLDQYTDVAGDVSLLFYNGAKLSAEQNINTMVAQDFMAYLQQKDIRGFNIADPWVEINRIDNIDQKKVVLFIEALNENPDAKDLLKKIDSLVENSMWPWLKVVVVARTEAWRLIRQGVQIAESRYYRSTHQEVEQIGVEMKPFTFSEEIMPFTNNELQKVYDKYKSFYKLQTEFEALPVEVKIAFRDPLVLRLIADTYQSRGIPNVINVNDLYKKYVDNLISTGRLTKNDVLFLEQELMPLMLNEKQYANKISEEELMNHQTSKGEKLFDVLFHDQNRQPSQTYLNLVDTEILAQQGSETSYELTFKYERFYDYFAARRLQGLLDTETDNLTKHQQLLLQLKETPFLWGAVRKILLDSLDKDINIALQLMYLKGQSVQKMMVEVLIEYGKTNDERKDVVNELLKRAIKRNTMPNPILGLDLIPAKFIAIDTAIALELVEILGLTAGDKNSSVRTHTAISASNCWTSNPGLAQHILDSMIENLNHQLPIIKLPNYQVFETLVSSVFMIFFGHYNDEKSTVPLADMIRKVYTTIIPVNPNSNLGRGVSVLAFRILFSIAIGLVDKATSGKGQNPPTAANLIEIAVYFSRSQTERDLMLDVLKLFYIDSNKIEDYVETYERVVALNDGDINWAVTHVMARHGVRNPIGTSRVLSKMFDQQMSIDRPSFHSAFLIEVFGYYLRRQRKTSENSELFFLFEHMVKVYSEKIKCRVHYKKSYIIEHLVITYMSTSFSLFQDINMGFVHSLILKAYHEKDWDLLNQYARGCCLMLSTPSIDLPVFSLLDMWSPLLEETNLDVIKPICKVIIRSQIAYPEEVDDFMRSKKHSKELSYLIATAQADISVNDLFQVSVPQFLFDAAASDNLLDSMVLLLGQMPRTKNMREWLSILIGYILNLSFGKEIFKLKMWPVDVATKIIKKPFGT